MPNRSRYRVVDYLPARILQARELLKEQAINRQVDDSNLPSAYALNALYRTGAALNMTPVISGTQVTLTPTDPSKPVLVFVRNQWEILLSTDYSTPFNLTIGQTALFLNYSVQLVTSAQDSQLVDSVTGLPTADMGELVFNISATDTSSVPLDTNSQLEKNLTPIVLLQFANVSGVLSYTPLDNVLPAALGTGSTSGLVKLSQDSAGIAAATNDPRLSDARTPLPASVVDVSVRNPVSVPGLNADGMPSYDLTQDPGGISADKIVWQEQREKLTDTLTLVRQQEAATAASLATHEPSTLGTPNSHPMPTAQQVGAAPASHVNQPLGIPGSHPATVTSDNTGFTVSRSRATPGPLDYAYETRHSDDGSIINGLLHNGDLFSILGSAFTASPLVESGETLTSGQLNLFSMIAAVLSQHVNKTSHKNPHGLALSDLGGAALSYVDTQDQAMLANAKLYTDAQVPHVTWRVEVIPTQPNGDWGTYFLVKFSPNGGTPLEFGLGTGRLTDTAEGNYGASMLTIPYPVGFTQGITNAGFLATVSNNGFGLMWDVNAAVGNQQCYSITTRYSGKQVASTGNQLSWWAFVWR